MIFKFQQGGTYVPPLVTYTPVMAKQEAAAATTAPKDTEDLTDSDLLKLLDKLDGLPNDMDTIKRALQNFYINKKYSPVQGTSNIASRYIAILAQIRTANFNRKEYDDAFKIVSDNGGINEVAVDERGRLFCMNADQDFRLLRPEELKDNSDYIPLTNSELLKYRARNPELAFNTSILGVVRNGIGINTVTDMINKVVDRLGNNDSEKSGYISTPKGNLITGIKELTTAIASAQQQGVKYNGTVDDLYKYKIVDSNQKSQIANAISYIYSTLPENAKTLLKTKTNDGSAEQCYQLIEKLIASQVDATQKFDITLEASNDGGSGKSKGSSSSRFPKMDPASMVQAGYGQKQMVTIQTASGGQNAIQVPTVKMLITSKEGKSLGPSTLADVAQSGFGGYLDFENTSMGGTMIPYVGQSLVAVDANALHVGYLPMDLEEFERHGNIRPDINLLARYNEAQKYVREHNITEPDEINAVYQEHRLPIIYDEKGDVLPTYRKFGMINGTTFSEAFAEDPTFDDYIHETEDKNIITNTLNIVQKGRTEDTQYQYDEKSWYNSLGIGDYSHVYEGTVFIPVNEDYFMGSAGYNPDVTTEQAAVIEAQQQAAQREEAANRHYVKPDNSL